MTCGCARPVAGLTGRCARLLAWLIIAAACRNASAELPIVADTTQQVAAHGRDGVAIHPSDSIIARLRDKLAPLDASFDSVPALLRPDSGTARADSLFLEVRSSLTARVRSVVQTFDDSAFQILMYPQGARGQQLRRQLQRSGMPLPPEDTLLADSLHHFLNAHGVWSYRGEGDTYFVLSLGQLRAVVAPFVTASTREYLRIETAEQTSPTGGDAAVGIPWDSLGDRLAAVDRFLAEYSQAATRDLIQYRRGWYLRAYLTGWDNTSVFAHDSERLRPEVRASFERYVDRHRSTASAQVVRSYLQLLVEHLYRRTPEIIEFLVLRSGIPRHD